MELTRTGRADLKKEVKIPPWRFNKSKSESNGAGMDKLRLPLVIGKLTLETLSVKTGHRRVVSRTVQNRAGELCEGDPS
jgi:hypothetical protein